MMKRPVWQNPKVIVACLVALLVLGGGGVFVYTKLSPSQPAPATETSKKKIVPTFNQLEVGQRPYLQILPLADGRNLDLRLALVKKTAPSVEYELEYQAGSLLQGAFGKLDLDSLPTTKRILLGSCSAGGACTYHENVKGGTLVLKFAGDEPYALKQEWRYFDNYGTKGMAFASKDAKLQIESKDLGKQRFVIVYNSPGYPEGLTGRPVSDPYSLTASGTLTGRGKLTLRATEEEVTDGRLLLHAACWR